MSFYHVLASNTSPATFPNNHASEFSTPVTNPYMLEGFWEVGLLNITHSNCIKTFNNEVIYWQQNTSDLTKILKARTIKLSIAETKKKDDVIPSLLRLINEKLKGIVKLTESKNYDYVEWKMQSKEHVLMLSSDLKTWFGILDVITPHDSYPSNYYPIKDQSEIKSNLSITVIPTSTALKKIVIKKVNEIISIKEMIKRFNERVQYDGKPLAKLVLDKNKTHIELRKFENEYIIVTSEGLHRALSHRQSGAYRAMTHRFWGNDLKKNFKEEFSVSIFTAQSTPYDNIIRSGILLHPKFFRKSEQVIIYLNEKFEKRGVSFSCKDDIATVSLDEGVTIEFDDVVRDILAFDSNRYEGKRDVVASGKLSLTRRINYLYVYSNITDYIRVGDIEAPLLAVFPLNPKSCGLLSENNFKTPMYIPVNANRISQIDIAIYDDNGKLIPFHEDATSMLRLHFKQKS